MGILFRKASVISYCIIFKSVLSEKSNPWGTGTSKWLTWARILRVYRLNQHIGKSWQVMRYCDVLALPSAAGKETQFPVKCFVPVPVKMLICLQQTFCVGEQQKQLPPPLSVKRRPGDADVSSGWQLGIPRQLYCISQRFLQLLRRNWGWIKQACPR